MVMGYEQKNPSAVIFSAKSAIRTPANLAGTPMGVAPGAETYKLLPAFLKAVHLSPASLKLDDMSPAAEPGALLHGTVPSILAFGTEIPPLLAAKGLPTHGFYFANYGVNPLNLGIVVNDRYLKRHPVAVKAVVDATAASIRATEAHPRTAVRIFEAHSNGVALQQLENSPPFLEPPNDKGKPLGWMSAEDWTATPSSWPTAISA